LAARVIIHHSDSAFMVDNEVLCEMYGRALDIERPTYKKLTRLIGRVVSSLSASLQFDGGLSTNFLEFEAKLVAYVCIYFPICLDAPLTSTEADYHEQLSVAEVKNRLVESASIISKGDHHHDTSRACTLRSGGDVVPKDVGVSVATITTKRTIQFADWCPTVFKIGINNRLPMALAARNLAKVQRGPGCTPNIRHFQRFPITFVCIEVCLAGHVGHLVLPGNRRQRSIGV
jgi:tubulin alpha